MTQKYYCTVGLEIHAELKTNTKMFCGCKNDPDEVKPNVNICPVCMAHPGTLPVINKKAIENVIKVGLALGADISDFTEFDRKNYFYPDIPKGYQISQYKYPIVSGGRLAGMDITRVHLEEDTANNKHFTDYSLIDFNRAGIPLMELVTEPHTFDSVEEAAKTASNFAKKYQHILQCLEASKANMEKGEMRVEANVSVSSDKNKKSIAYVEVKNLNSFRSVERAIKYEVERMTKLLEEGKGEEIVKETRGWDEGKQKTFSQRSKEDANDYRYFPDPDLPKLKLHDKETGFDLKKIKQEVQETLKKESERMQKESERMQKESERIKSTYPTVKENHIPIYLSRPDLIVNFEKTAQEIPIESADRPLRISVIDNIYTSSVISIKKENEEAHYPDHKELAHLSGIFVTGGIGSTAAKQVVEILMTSVKPTDEIIKEKKLVQVSDEKILKAIVYKIINENPEVVASYKSGKENAIMSLVGKVIKESNGSANPQVVIKLLKEMLK